MMMGRLMQLPRLRNPGMFVSRTRISSFLAKRTRKVDTSQSAKLRAIFAIPFSSLRVVGMTFVTCLTSTRSNAKSRIKRLDITHSVLMKFPHPVSCHFDQSFHNVPSTSSRKNHLFPVIFERWLFSVV